MSPILLSLYLGDAFISDVFLTFTTTTTRKRQWPLLL